MSVRFRRIKGIGIQVITRNGRTTIPWSEVRKRIKFWGALAILAAVIICAIAVSRIR